MWVGQTPGDHSFFLLTSTLLSWLLHSTAIRADRDESFRPLVSGGLAEKQKQCGLAFVLKCAKTYKVSFNIWAQQFEVRTHTHTDKGINWRCFVILLIVWLFDLSDCFIQEQSDRSWSQPEASSAPLLHASVPRRSLLNPRRLFFVDLCAPTWLRLHFLAHAKW